MSTAPVKSISGGGEVPDYAAFCPDYFRGCFFCPEFMPDRVRFCRKWNRIFNGVDVVELELIEGEEGAADTKGASRARSGDGGREDRSWWTYGRRRK